MYYSICMIFSVVWELENSKTMSIKACNDIWNNGRRYDHFICIVSRLWLNGFTWFTLVKYKEL